MSSDRGAMALELSIIAPVVFLLLFGTVQAGLYFHARQVAHHAAEQGVERGRAWDATSSDGTAAARSFLQRMGGSVDDARVRDLSSSRRVKFEVTGTVASLVPGLRLPVTAQVQAPKERWVP